MEHALATALAALQEPTTMAPAHVDAPIISPAATRGVTRTVFGPRRSRGPRLNINGPYGRASGPFEETYVRDCQNFSKVLPGYPQAARVTVSLKFSL
ncbi:MAG: hypothetical protein AAGJ87_03865 [Pseudomonadota bacterium]